MMMPIEMILMKKIRMTMRMRMRMMMMIIEAWPGTFDRLSPESANYDDANAL